MCMACELLQGIDIEALSPSEGLPRYPVHFPDGTGAADVAAFHPSVDEVGAAGRLRRAPSPRSNQHWRAEPLQPALQALIADPAAALKAESMAVPAGAKIVVHLSGSIMLSSTHAKARAIELGDQTAAPAGKSRLKKCVLRKISSLVSI
jgi:hypothetical protein